MGGLHLAVVIAGWLTLAAAAAVALLMAASVVGRFVTGGALHNLQTDSEFFAGVAMMITLLLVILFLLLAGVGFAWTSFSPSPEHEFFARMSRYGLIGLAIALAGGFLGIKVFRGGILPH